MRLILGNRNCVNSIIDSYNFEIINNKYGKPLIRSNNLYFNKSHCDDISVAIIDNQLCGIDIENIRKYNDLMAKKICSYNEYEFLKKSKNIDYDFTLLWVLKESYLKCIGVGLSYPLKKVSFVANDKISFKKEQFILNVINYKNHLISICRKD